MSATPSQAEVSLVLECGGGGAARHVLDVYRGLTARGWRVKIIASLVRADPLFLSELQSIPAADLVEIEMHRRPHWSDLRALRQLERETAGSSPRIVHAHSTKAGLLVSRLRSPALTKVFTPHAYRGLDRGLPPWQAWAIRLLEEVISRPYDRIIAVSEEEREYARQLGIAAGSVVYIPNGVDFEALQQRVSSSRKRRVDRTPTIGFVGRLVHQKNPMAFVRSFKALLDAEVEARAIVIGDGPLKDELVAECRFGGFSERISFLGAVEAVEHLGEFDVFVHTSRYESLPYSILEAIAAGIPIVATENSGSIATLGKVQRLVKDPDDIAGLASAVRGILASASERERLLQGNAAAMHEFSLDVMCSRIEAQYHRLLNRTTARSPNLLGLA